MISYLQKQNKTPCYSPCSWTHLFFSLFLKYAHFTLFTLANTVEAAALGNELALPVAHTSLQLLTKFHHKNLYYTGEHRSVQEHSFIFR